MPARKLVEFIASLMILIPCVLLLAWEPSLPGASFYWAILLVCSGTFLAALFVAEHRAEELTLWRFINKCGGFCLMFFFILYKTATMVF